MRIGAQRLLATLAAPLLVAGCLFDTTVPSVDGVPAHILCAGTTECPPQWRCVEELGRCLPVGAELLAAPALSVACDEDGSVDVVLASDGTVARIVEPARRGEVRELEAGVFRYTPAANAHGTDSFTYALSGGDSISAEAPVIVEVAPVNDAPACATWDLTTGEDDAVAESVPCFDVDGDAFTVALAEPPARGRVDLGEGFLLYEPNVDVFGPDAFTLTVTDEPGAAADLVVDVDVAPVNDAPTLADARLLASTQAGVPVTILVPAVDVDGDPLGVEIAAPPADGVAVIVPGGVRYTPSASAEGVVTFQVVARDGGGEASTPGTVEVVVQSRRSCAVIANMGGGAGDGVYAIDPLGTGRFDAYCDMARFGGGWELAMKVDGSPPGAEFSYFDVESTLWIDDELARDSSLNLDRVIAKLRPFIASPFTELMVVAQTPDADDGAVTSLWARLAAPGGRTLREIFASEEYVPTTGTRDGWLGLVPGSALQPTCGREGLNVKEGLGGIDGSLEMRFGFVADDEASCEDPDSAIGIGWVNFPIAGARCSDSPACDALVGAESDGVIRAFMWLYVRNTDFTSLQPAASCLEHAARGAHIAGTYLVDDGSGPVVTVCDL